MLASFSGHRKPASSSVHQAETATVESTSGSTRGKTLPPADMEQVMEPTDQALWAQAQAGDAAAFGALYQRHARAVYQFCFWRTADAGLAEELSAAVFLEAWRRRGRTALTQPNVLPWLLGVAVNLLRNQRRAARRRQAALERLSPLLAEPDLADAVAARMDAEQAMRAIRRAVDRLPPREQEVLELCVWAGLDYQQAAQILGVAPGTVGSRLSRARAHLRRALDLAEAPPGDGHAQGERDPVLGSDEGGAQWRTEATS
jgi:RNA polymerase sigma factor (sigma-70 family)